MDVGISLNHAVQSGLPKGLEGPKANTKSGAHNTECARVVWGHAPPGNLHALKCVMEFNVQC